MHADIACERLPCIAHTLQLVVKDGFKEIKVVDRAVSQAACLVSKAHHSYKIRERLDVYQAYLHQRNNTRWSSEFNMVKSLLKLPNEKIDEIFNVKNGLTKTSRECLEDLVILLDGFNEVTVKIQSEAFSMGYAFVMLRGTYL